MKPYKVLHVAPDHVVVDDGSGTPFKVATSHRHVATVQKILKMAEGGEVKPKEDEKQGFLKRLFPPKHSDANSSPAISAARAAIDERQKRFEQIEASEKMADGGEVTKKDPPWDPLWNGALQQQEEQDRMVNASDASLLQQGVPDPPYRGYPNPGAAVNLPVQPNRPNPDAASNPYGPASGLSAQQAMFGGAPPGPAQDVTPAEGMFGKGATFPGWPPPGATAAPGIQEGAPVATAGAPPEQPPDVPLPGLPSGQGPPVPGTAEQLAGIKAKGTAEAGLGQAQQSAWQQHQQQMAGLTAGLQKDYADNQARQDALSGDILNGKVEPNRLWHNMGTGQKISAVIGMILGGIGAGMTHGPNYAAQVIDKAIDRDMEAQKIDLGKKQSQLSYYLQRGHNLQSSYALAKADAMDRTAAQIQAAQGQFGGQVAQASAQQAAGLVKQQASVLRQQGYAMTLQNQERQLNMAAQQYQMQVQRQLLKGVSGGGGWNRQMLEMPGMDKYRERAVDMPDGTIAFAKDKEEATKASESMATVARLKPKLQRYRQLLESGSPRTLDKGTAETQHADLLSEMGHLHDLNRLSDTDLELFKDQVPDISEWFRLDSRARQKLAGVGKSLDDKVWSLNSSVLHRPGKRPNG